MIVTMKKPTLMSVPGMAQPLKPGANNVDPKLWLEIRKHKSIQRRLEAGILVEEQDPEELVKLPKEKQKAAGEGALKGMNIPNAIALVKETVDKGLLESWAKVEGRDKVKAALKKQIADLETPPEMRDRTQKRQLSTGAGPEVIETRANPSAQDD